MRRTNKGAPIAASRMSVSTTPLGGAPVVKITTRTPMMKSETIQHQRGNPASPDAGEVDVPAPFALRFASLQQHAQTASTEPRIMR